MLLASAKLWSIHCPEDTRVLYASRVLGTTIKSLGIPKLFHEIIPLYNLPFFPIDSSVFWSYPKLQVLSQVKEPVTLVDHDFMTFCNLRKVVDPGKVCYNFTEDAREYYPTIFDPYVKALSYKTRWPDTSANVSFLQLPDPEFTRFYAGTSLQIMEEFTRLKAPNSRYLILAEQMVLKHLLEGQDYQCLIKNKYICREERFGPELDPNGIWTYQDSEKQFLHYGPVKKRWSSVELKRELDFLQQISGI